MAAAAECGAIQSSWPDHFMENLEEQRDEVLALKSIFEDDGGDRIHIFNEVKNCKELQADQNEELPDRNHLYTIELNIPVKLEVNEINVDICMPNEETCEQDMPEDKKSGSVDFKRSESGHNLIGTVTLSHLTPLTLMAVLPPEYPSCGPPKITLTCLWLSGPQLSSLCNILDKLWEDQFSMPILYTWIDWLENNCLSYLGIRERIIIRQVDEEDISDDRVIPECYDVGDTVNSLMRYSMEMENAEFYKSEHECGVCYMEYVGSYFFRIKQCKHFICQECMRSYCKLHVKDGTVLELVCPEPSCKVDIPPDILKDVLGEEEFIRWERLVLQKGLEKMGDVVWCPRCGHPVVKDSDLAHCFNCYYTFCIRCLASWHQGEECASDDSKLEEGMKKLENKKKGKKETQEDIQKEIQKEMEKLHQEFQSTKLVKGISRPCPQCRANIQKDGGCNKVTCTLCHSSLCWVCGKNITKEGYGHFTNSCNTFTYNEVDDYRPFRQHLTLVNDERHMARNRQRFAMQARLETSPKTKTLNCPNCKQKNVRDLNNNNHIKCWNCSCNFCYLCKLRLPVPVTKHYQRGPCKQHTDV